jgi:histidinol-phosphate/aromatic aminotransferase/cobyric acid decarboxylase-like protein
MQDAITIETALFNYRDILHNFINPWMLAKSIAVGRSFEHLEKMMRVTIGTDAEMAKFRVALTDAMSA